MSAMEQLGRQFNVIPIAAGVGISLKQATGVTFVTTGSDTFTLTCSSVFGSGYASPGTITSSIWKTASASGTAAWVQDQTLISANTIVTTVTTAFYISAVFLPDGKTYVKLAAGGSGLVTAILGDLLVRRMPSNLPILSA